MKKPGNNYRGDLLVDVNAKKGVIIGLIAGIISFILSAGVGIGFAPLYEGVCGCMLNTMEPIGLWVFKVFVVTLAYGIGLGLVFSLAYDILPKGGFIKGFWFGFWIWVITSFFPELLNSLIINLPKAAVLASVLAQLGIHIITWGLAGMLYEKLGKVFR